jgi:hypothetical protein
VSARKRPQRNASSKALFLHGVTKIQNALRGHSNYHTYGHCPLRQTATPLQESCPPAAPYWTAGHWVLSHAMIQLVKIFRSSKQPENSLPCLQKNSLDHNLSYFNPVHALSSNLCKADFNILLPAMPTSLLLPFLLTFSDQNSVYICHSPHECYMTPYLALLLIITISEVQISLRPSQLDTKLVPGSSLSSGRQAERWRWPLTCI